MASAQDDAFREIQLSGKQLVFIFMAVVVIGVSVFLMGVMVGRGVLAAKGAPGVEASSAANETEPPPPPASASQGSSTTPSTAGEKLTYAERLGSEQPLKEPLKPEAAPPAEAPSPKSEAPVTETTAGRPEASPTTKPAGKAATATATTPAPAKPAPVLAPEPAGAGFAIQVAALKEPTDADAIVKRLAGKGYPAYVVAPAKGTPTMYKVRVGKYKDRHEADSVAARLQKEEQFKPWIVK